MNVHGLNQMVGVNQVWVGVTSSEVRKGFAVMKAGAIAVKLISENSFSIRAGNSTKAIKTEPKLNE